MSFSSGFWDRWSSSLPLPWSLISPAEWRVMYTDSSLESTETVFFRINSFVPGFRPKCSSNGVFLVSEWKVKRGQIVFYLDSHADFVFLLIFFHQVFHWLDGSFDQPVPVCIFGVPNLQLKLYSLEILFYSFEIKALLLSDFITIGLYRYTVDVDIIPSKCYDRVVVCIFTNFRHRPRASFVYGKQGKGRWIQMFTVQFSSEINLEFLGFCFLRTRTWYLDFVISNSYRHSGRCSRWLLSFRCLPHISTL